MYNVGDNFERYPTKKNIEKEHTQEKLFQTFAQLMPGLLAFDGYCGRIVTRMVSQFGDCSLKEEKEFVRFSFQVLQLTNY